MQTTAPTRWESADVQFASIMTLKKGKGNERYRCCNRWFCISEIHEDELWVAIEDVSQARDRVYRAFNFYIQTIHLCSSEPIC